MTLRKPDGDFTPSLNSSRCIRLKNQPERVAELKKLRQSLDPFHLGKLIDEKLQRIYDMANRRLNPKGAAENHAGQETQPGRRNGYRGSSVTFPMSRRLNPRLHPQIA